MIHSSKASAIKICKYYVKTNGMIKAKLQKNISSLYTKFNMKYDQENIFNSTMFEKTVNIQWCVSKVFQYMSG